MTRQTRPGGNTWNTDLHDDGAFVRAPSSFRERIARDGSTRFAPAAGRYHLYVSLACPWAHRTLVVRALKGLEGAIGVDVVHPYLGAEGWSFDTGFPGATGDRVNGFRTLRQAYQRTDPAYAGRITVPVLWDKQLGTIVNNESAEIIRMFNSEFQDLCAHPQVDLVPPDLRAAIDATNDWVYPAINDGVYRCGFARSQGAFDRAFEALFAALDRAEATLSAHQYLCGERFTEADVRLFTTLIRFDAVYHTHFKCNRRTISQYPSLHRYLARIYRMPGVAGTVDFEHIRFHYYHSHRQINPWGIVPPGPDVVAGLERALN